MHDAGQVKRWLSLLREMQLPALVRLIQRLTQPPTGSPPAAAKCRPGAAAQSGSSFLWLPTRGAVLAALHRLRGSCRAVVELVPAVRRAAAALSGQLAHGFFVPFCLTATALAARIQARAAFVSNTGCCDQHPHILFDAALAAVAKRQSSASCNDVVLWVSTPVGCAGQRRGPFIK